MPRDEVTGTTFASWAAGYGPIQHTQATRRRVRAMARALQKRARSALVVARLLGMDRAALLTADERAALDRRVSPQGVLF